MISRIEHNGVEWIDVHSPLPDDIIKIAKELEIHPRVVEELLHPSFRPRAESFGHHLYLILHVPTFDRVSQLHRAHELDIVTDKNTLLTVHYDIIEPMHEFFRSLQLNLALRDKVLKGGPERLLYALWARIYKHLLSELDHVQKKIDRVEERIFAGHERELIRDISLLRRDVLDFGRAVKPHDGVLESLERIRLNFFSERFGERLFDLWGKHRRMVNILDANRDTLGTLYATNDSLLTHRSNEIIKTLTILALLTFPLSLIATIFSIDAVSRPIVGGKYDFWIIVGIMLCAIAGMLMYFKHRRWI